jgi:hypothetical protein
MRRRKRSAGMSREQWLALKRREGIVTDWDRRKARLHALGQLPPDIPFGPPPRCAEVIRAEAAAQLAERFAALRLRGWRF